LRACRQRHGDACDITERHILAADRLRRYTDGARIGFSIEHDLSLPVARIVYSSACPLAGVLILCMEVPGGAFTVEDRHRVLCRD
jgi:hypothetical protein